jgi:hypothetical protein
MSSRTESMRQSYRQRAAATTTTVETEEPEVIPADVEDDTLDELPDESWKKSDIVDYLVDSGIEVDADDLKKMTKAELVDRFVG